MAARDHRATMVVDRIASASSSALAHSLLLAGCYFVAVLATQITLYDREGSWFGSACALHRQIDVLSRCDLSTSELWMVGGALSYVMTQVDALVVIATMMIFLAGARVAIGALRGRLAVTRISAVAWSG